MRRLIVILAALSVGSGCDDRSVPVAEAGSSPVLIGAVQEDGVYRVNLDTLTKERLLVPLEAGQHVLSMTPSPERETVLVLVQDTATEEAELWEIDPRGDLAREPRIVLRVDPVPAPYSTLISP